MPSVSFWLLATKRLVCRIRMQSSFLNRATPMKSESGSQLKLSFQLTAHQNDLEVRATSPYGEGKAVTTLPSQELPGLLAKRGTTSISSSTLTLVGRALYQSL